MGITPLANGSWIAGKKPARIIGNVFVEPEGCINAIFLLAQSRSDARALELSQLECGAQRLKQTAVTHSKAASLC